MTTVAAIYTRVSSPSQATVDAVSLEEQERVCRALCEREGWEVVEHYQDAGLSATSDTLDNRPALQRLLRDAAAGRFARLVCYHTDRLARNTEAASLIASVCKLGNVLVATPSQGTLDLSDLQSKLLYLVGGWSAELEAKRIRERCDAGRRGYAMRGDFPVWMEPFGYKWISGDLRRGIPNRLEAVPEQLATVRLAFDLATRRGLSIRQIAAELNRRGLRTRGGAQWYPSDVSYMLKDPRYCGQWRVWKEGDQEYFAREDLVPEVAVSEKVWRRAQKARAHHKARTRRPMKHGFLLNSFLICAECGSPMAGHQISDAPVLRYYCCQKKKANRDKPCRSRYVPAEALEGEALALLHELAEHPEAARAYAEATRVERLPSLREESKRVTRAIKGAQNEIDGLIRELARGEITGEDLARLRPALEQDVAAWQERLGEVEREITDAEMTERAAEVVSDMLGGLGQRVSELDLPRQRWLLAQLDFRMTLACEDWRAKARERRYQVAIEWAGAAFVGENATRDYVGSPNALAT